MVPLSQVVLKLVDDKRASDDVVRPLERDLLVGDVDFARSVVVDGDVPEVARVSVFVRRRSVVLSERVEVRSGGHASVGGVPEFVHVQPVQSSFESCEGPLDTCGSVRVGRERERAFDARGSLEHDDRLGRVHRDRSSPAETRGRRALES